MKALHHPTWDHTLGSADLYGLLMQAHSEVANFGSCIALGELGFYHLALSLGQVTPDERVRLPFPFDVTRSWPTIAAHEAISILYQFEEVLSAIREWASATPFRDNLLVPDAGNNATALFEKHFPKWKQSRHATAHSAEIRLNAENNFHEAPLSRGQIRKKKGAKIIISDSFEGRTFITTRKGELLRFDVTWESFDRLVEVYDLLRLGLTVKPGPLVSDQTSHQSSPDDSGKILP